MDIIKKKVHLFLQFRNKLRAGWRGNQLDEIVWGSNNCFLWLMSYLGHNEMNVFGVFFILILRFFVLKI